MRGNLLKTGVLLGVCVAFASAAPGAPAASAADTSRTIVTFEPSVPAAQRQHVVRAAGGRVIRDLHLIDGLGVVVSRAAADARRRDPGVRSMTRDAAVRTRAARVGSAAAGGQSTVTSAAPAAP